uniref:Uncharacterized protein n=1 Tax=Arundo donax TaxID=35708 RepID=A0A0A8ZJA0_ARUDO
MNDEIWSLKCVTGKRAMSQNLDAQGLRQVGRSA